MAFDYDGGWAEYRPRSSLSLTRVPDNVPLDQAAILADAVATPYGAVVNTAKVQVAESVGVWGLGGIGTHIVQIARLVGAAPIVVLDLVPEIRQRALELGRRRRRRPDRTRRPRPDPRGDRRTWAGRRVRRGRRAGDVRPGPRRGRVRAGGWSASA